MPELPEVETVLRTIWPHLAGRRIEAIEVSHPDVVAPAQPAEFTQQMCGATFRRARRRGKYLVFALTTGAGGRLAVLVHLRMTGKLASVPAGAPAPAHTHLRLRLDGGQDLLFTDTRRFGRWTILGEPDDQPKGYLALGPEPLGRGFSAAVLAQRLAGKKGKLKALLLDQRLVAGIGNIYADEILHRARLHPARTADSLDERELKRLHRSIRAVLREAIGKGGTTIRDYVDGRGRKGDFVYSLRVYGRAGEDCPGCGTPVERVVIAGRSTYYCHRCQPETEAGDGEKGGG